MNWKEVLYNTFTLNVKKKTKTSEIPVLSLPVYLFKIRSMHVMYKEFIYIYTYKSIRDRRCMKDLTQEESE